MRLVPRYSTVRSRSDIDTSIEFLGHRCKLPIVPANMATVISPELAYEFADNGYFYILHRFMFYREIAEFVRSTRNTISSISIGVKDEDYGLIDYLNSNDLLPDFITVDIAHGHSILMKEMLEFLRHLNVKVIAGNVGTDQAVHDLIEWGADSVKCGIANGSGCQTYNQTGFKSYPEDIQPLYFEQPLIADGGVKETGDIVKYLAQGYEMVMIGGLLAGFEDSPTPYYEGSTTQNSMYKEGKRVELDQKKGKVFDQLKVIEQGLQSAISYAGGNLMNVERKDD